MFPTAHGTVAASAERLQTKRLVAAMTTAPSAARRALIDATIFDLIAAGLWSKLGVLYVLAAHDAQAARLNWKDPTGSLNLVAVNSPAFTADSGYAGDGTAAYLRLGSGATPGGIPGWALNDACFGYRSSGNGNAMVGTSATGVVELGGTTTGTPALRGTINDATEDDFSIAQRNGHLVMVRSGATSKQGYRNGVASTAVATASTAVATNDVRLLKYRANFGTATLRLFHAGRALTAAEVASLYTIANTYLTAVGAV